MPFASQGQRPRSPSRPKGAGLQSASLTDACWSRARTSRPPQRSAPNVSLAFLPNGTLLTGSFDGSLERWDVRTGRRLDAAPTAPTGPVAGIAVAPGSAIVLTSSLTSGTLREWSPVIGRVGEGRR